jgi:hypothetical protein
MMADEPDNIIPVMLADIRMPDGRSRHFDEIEMRPTDIEKRLDHGKKIVRHAQLRQRQQQSRNDEPLRKLERLLLDKLPV